MQALLPALKWAVGGSRFPIDLIKENGHNKKQYRNEDLTVASHLTLTLGTARLPVSRFVSILHFALFPCVYTPGFEQPEGNHSCPSYEDQGPAEIGGRFPVSSALGE